jgi:hypothetical protein
VYNEDNLDKVFAKADANGDGTLCHREVAAVLGEDHEFARELLEQIAEKRGGDVANLSDLHMTLPEFKAMFKSQNPKSTQTRGRRKHGEKKPAGEKV